MRELRDPAGGGRIYSDPYTGTFAAEEQARVHQQDPHGVLLLLKLYADETPITKAMERCVYPMSVYNLALPLETLLGWADRPVELVKIDAQGLDMTVVATARSRLAQVRRFAVEVISDDCETVSRLAARTLD